MALAIDITTEKQTALKEIGSARYYWSVGCQSPSGRHEHASGVEVDPYDAISELFAARRNVLDVLDTDQALRDNVLRLLNIWLKDEDTIHTVAAMSLLGPLTLINPESSFYYELEAFSE